MAKIAPLAKLCLRKIEQIIESQSNNSEEFWKEWYKLLPVNGLNIPDWCRRYFRDIAHFEPMDFRIDVAQYRDTQSKLDICIMCGYRGKRIYVTENRGGILKAYGVNFQFPWEEMDVMLNGRVYKKFVCMKCHRIRYKDELSWGASVKIMKGLVTEDKVKKITKKRNAITANYELLCKK